MGVANAMAISTWDLTAFIVPMLIIIGLPLLTFLIVAFMLMGQYVALYIRYIAYFTTAPKSTIRRAPV